MKPCRKCGGPNDRRPQRYCSDCHASEERVRRTVALLRKEEVDKALAAVLAKRHAPRETLTKE